MNKKQYKLSLLNLFLFYFVWIGGNNGLNGFGEFIYESVVPATFMTPMKSTFDMNDAQTILVCINKNTSVCL